MVPQDEDLGAVLALRPVAAGRLASVLTDANLNGRVFGGQILGQAVAAASDGIDGQDATVLQLLFLQGAAPDVPVEYVVTELQAGRRMTSRHVRGVQGERLICDAHVSFQVPGSGFEHQAAPMPDVPAPETLRTLDELDAELARARPNEEPYRLQQKRRLDLRLIEPERFLFQPADTPSLRFWVRARHRLGDAPLLHAAALAYISDYWLNYAGLALHRGVFGARGGLYVASLNHSLWLHQPCRADEWLLVSSESPRAVGGRSLSRGLVHRRDGTLVASVSQEIMGTLRA